MLEMRLAVDQLEATGNNNKSKIKKGIKECSRVVIGRLEAYLVEAMNGRNEEASFASDVAHID